MKRTRTHTSLLNRKLVAAAVLCLFVFKGLSFLGMTAELAMDPQGANPVIAKAILGAHCENTQDKNIPDQKHEAKSECCVFCASSGRDQAFLNVAILAQIITVLSPDAADASLVYDSHQLDIPRPAILSYDWSATAPPTA